MRAREIHFRDFTKVLGACGKRSGRESRFTDCSKTAGIAVEVEA